MRHSMIWSVVAVCGLLCARAVGQTGGPSMEDEFLRAVAADSAASKPADGTGTLIVRATQGTKDGPKLGGETVVVELYCASCDHGELKQKYEGVLGAAGLVSFSWEPPKEKDKLLPIVTVSHAGFPYRVRGEPVGADAPDPVIKVPVYETTTTTPPWTIMARHVVATPVPGGMGVTEKVVVVNPTDRTWMPAQVNPTAMATVVLPLPPGAINPELLNPGANPVPGNAAGGQLFLANPVPPGVSRISLQYIVPLVDGEAKIELKAPAKTASMLIVVPTNGVEVKGENLTPQALEVKTLRGYLAPEMSAGQSLRFTLTVPTASTTGLSAGKLFTRIGLGVLAGLVIVGILAKVIKSRRPIKPQDPEAHLS